MKTFEFSKKGFEEAKNYTKERNKKILLMLVGVTKAFVNISSTMGV